MISHIHAEELRERRRVAVQKFLEDNAELFAVTDIEKEAHAEDCEHDGECPYKGMTVLDNWLFVAIHVSIDDPSWEYIARVTSQGLTWTREAGIVKYLDSLV